MYEHFMDKDLLKRLLSYGEEKGIAMGLTIGDKDYFINPAEVERIDKIRWKESMRNFQDPWEMLITFLISQRKSIPPSRTAVEHLARCCGEPLSAEGDEVSSSLPRSSSAASLRRS